MTTDDTKAGPALSITSTFQQTRQLVDPALRDAVDRIPDATMRMIAGYHFGWLDRDARPLDASAGKGIRPALTLLSAQAAGGSAVDGVAAAVAVELVHNFSLVHDDIMDKDVERRHRPTAWVVFGEGQAILAGNAMLTAAVDVLVSAGVPGHRALPCLLDAIQRLISGQSSDLAYEGRPTVTLDDVLAMEAGKTAALLECATSIGAIAVGAAPETVNLLARFGFELGMAFQLVDDILGITGDEAATGKSSSSDVRAGKRSAPVVAALASGGDAAVRLGRLLDGGPPTTDDDVTLAAKLIDEAGGLDWAAREAGRRLDLALEQLDAVNAPAQTSEALAALARYVVDRDR